MLPRSAEAPLLLTIMAALQACGGGSAGSNTGGSSATAPIAQPTASQPRQSRKAQSFTVPVGAPGVPTSAFTSYEVAQVHPMDLTPDGSHLLVTNTANGTLEIFQVDNGNMTLGSVI